MQYLAFHKYTSIDRSIDRKKNFNFFSLRVSKSSCIGLKRNFAISTLGLFTRFYRYFSIDNIVNLHYRYASSINTQVQITEYRNSKLDKFSVKTIQFTKNLLNKLCVIPLLPPPPRPLTFIPLKTKPSRRRLWPYISRDTCVPFSPQVREAYCTYATTEAESSAN